MCLIFRKYLTPLLITRCCECYFNKILFQATNEPKNIKRSFSSESVEWSQGKGRKIHRAAIFSWQ